MTDARPIHSLSEFMETIESERDGRVAYFRGQTQDWRLVPGLGRLDRPLDLIEDIETKYINKLKYDLGITNEWEVAAIAQHYKIPTRLLDWSESPLIGLYFAVEDDTYVGKDGVLWVFRDRFAISKQNAYFYGDKNPWSLKYPRPFRAWHDRIMGKTKFHIPRLMAQCGVLTWQRCLKTPFESHTFEDNKKPVKYIIKSENKLAIRDELLRMGINRSALFPDYIDLGTGKYQDIVGMCMDLKCKISNF